MPDETTVRLYCFSHAGAGVSTFYGWTDAVGPGVDVVPVLLPGREGRRREARLTDDRALLDDLWERFAVPAATGPYVMYGHSLGALVAYTLVGALQEAGVPGPGLLALGACPPPDVGAELSDACDAPDDELMELLDRAGALPGPARHADFWRRAVLPVLRDDLVLADALRVAARGSRAAESVAVPLLGVAGDRDPLASPETVAGWSRWTRGPVRVRTVPGDHFFLRGAELPRLLGRACRVVGRLSPAGGRAAAERSHLAAQEVSS